MILGNIYHQEEFEKIKPQQVYKDDRFHVMLVKIKKDELLKPHHATTDAFLTVIEGSIVFTLLDTDTTLKKGDMISFKAYETHAVKALEDASFLLIK
jgi:quercetin dioxygenase-like cupin family protein